MIQLLITLFLLIAIPPISSIYATELELELEPRNEKFVDRFHISFSNSVLGTARRIDRFLGKDRAFEETNKSHVQIYHFTTFLEDRSPISGLNYKIKLVLPRTEERFRLVVENMTETENKEGTSVVTEPAQIPSAATTKTKTDKTGESGEDTTRSTTAALRYLASKRGIKASFDLGLIFTSRIQLFYRIRLRKNYKLGNWLFRPTEEYMWIIGEGRRSTTGLDFDKKLTDKWHFRFANGINWYSNDSKFLYFNNGPSWYQTINERMMMSYNLRAHTSYSERFSKDNYSASVSFRQLLYKKWFYWTVTPALNFPKETDYRRTPSLTIRFDTIFGYI